MKKLLDLIRSRKPPFGQLKFVITSYSIHYTKLYDPFSTFGLTKRVSLDYMGGEPNGASFAPVIAPGGRHIAYVSAATDLVSNDTNNAWDVFAYDGQRVVPTFLNIPTNVSGSVGDTVSVPVEFLIV